MDKRILNTKKALKESLFELLKQKPIERITVKQLCINADINRSTFYTYYKTPEELLSEIENELYNELKDAADKGGGIPEAVSNMLCAAADKALLLGVMTDQACFREYMKSIYEILKSDCLSKWMREYSLTAQQAEQAYVFASGGAQKLFEGWLASGMSEDYKDTANAIVSLALSGVKGFSA